MEVSYTSLDNTKHNAMIADASLQNIGLHDPVSVVSEYQVNRGARILSNPSRFTNNLRKTVVMQIHQVCGVTGSWSNNQHKVTHQNNIRVFSVDVS